MGLGHRLFGRPLIAMQDSERAHARALRNLRRFGNRRLLRTLYGSRDVPTQAFGLDFRNPVGLAAGMDKKAECILQWEHLGFGWIEIGGVTEHAQEGNPKPRMFRSGDHQALINRMGFNNPGSEAMAAQLLEVQGTGRWPSVPLAVNLGKSKITPNESAETDYATTLERLWTFADIFVVNVSSPNTPHLRELQSGSELDRILTACNAVNDRLADGVAAARRPILVKVAPDLSDDQLRAVADTAMAMGCAGIVATNTTLARPAEGGVMTQVGGLSGRPLRARSTEVIHLLYAHTEGRLPIVGVGGISNAESAWEKIVAGASLLQLYSALVFEGAGVVKAINKGLLKKLEAHGLDRLADAVGLAHRS